MKLKNGLYFELNKYFQKLKSRGFAIKLKENYRLIPYLKIEYKKREYNF